MAFIPRSGSPRSAGDAEMISFIADCTSFESVPAEHPLRKAADQIAEGFVKRYGCRKMTVKEIFDGHGDFNLVMMQKHLVPNSETFGDNFVFTARLWRPPRENLSNRQSFTFPIWGCVLK